MTERQSWSRRSFVLALIGLVVGVSSAVGATLVLTSDDVQRFLPKGHVVFVGTEPRCDTITDGVVYDCVLSRAATDELGYDDAGHPDFEGMVVQIVDDADLIAGGCRALADDGISWRCYVGEEAVAQGILGDGVLGSQQDGPASG